MKTLRPTRNSTRAIATVAALLLALVAFAGAASAAAAGKVNVNSADVDQLTLLPRVGPSIAQRIVDHREQNGPFEVAEDLMLVRGIGEKTFERMEPYVALEGETTLTEKVRGSAPSSGSDDSGDERR